MYLYIKIYTNVCINTDFRLKQCINKNEYSLIYPLVSISLSDLVSNQLTSGFLSMHLLCVNIF